MEQGILYNIDEKPLYTEINSHILPLDLLFIAPTHTHPLNKSVSPKNLGLGLDSVDFGETILKWHLMVVRGGCHMRGNPRQSKMF